VPGRKVKTLHGLSAKFRKDWGAGSAANQAGPAVMKGPPSRLRRHPGRAGRTAARRTCDTGGYGPCTLAARRTCTPRGRQWRAADVPAHRRGDVPAPFAGWRTSP